MDKRNRWILIFCSLLSVGIYAQDKKILDLRQTYVYTQELLLENGETMHIFATKLDWEQTAHEAAAMLELEKIMLPQKEALSSYALTLRVLQRQPESVFYRHPTSYSKLLAPFLTEEENTYLQDQLRFFDSLNQGRTGIELGRCYLYQTYRTRNFALLADSLIARTYTLPDGDPSDFEAILRAEWAEAAAREGKFDIAIEQQKKVYQIRKDRKDWLSYSYVPLANFYQSTQQWDALLDLYRDALHEIDVNDYTNKEYSLYSIWEMIGYIAEYGDMSEALNYFEQWAPRIAESNLSVWRRPGWIPYNFAIRQAEDEFEALAYAQRWAAQLRKYVGANIHQSDIIPILEALKPFAFNSKSVATYMQTLFEEFYFPVNQKLSWKRDDSRYWFWVVPYQRVLLHLNTSDEKLPVLHRWLKFALRTENYEIIRETAFHVAYNFAQLGEMELADSIFVKHYCSNLIRRSDDKEAWFQAAPYSLAGGEKAEYWYNRWITLAQNHAGTAMQIKILRFVARKYYDQKRYAESVPFHLKVLEIYRREQDLEGQERSLSHLLWLHRDVLKDPVATTEYTIRLYDCIFVYYRLMGYKLHVSYLESAFAMLVRQEKLPRKEKKKIVDLWQNWAAALDRSDAEKVKIKRELESLLKLLNW